MIIQISDGYTEQYFLVVLFSLLFMVVLTVDSVDEILKCWTIQMKAAERDYFPLLLFFYAVQGGSNSKVTVRK